MLVRTQDKSKEHHFSRKSTKMAPSITETVSLHSAPKTSLRTDAGYNKENGVGYRETYQHDNEIKGTAKQPPASFPNYLPVWDNETEKYRILILHHV